MIAVFGSLNMDFVVQVATLPAPGETVLGSGFQTLPGGKGANQAYAAAKLGAQVRMIGAVGRDVFGAQLKQSLSSVGVDVSRVEELAGEPTGVALISVDARAQNCIVVASGSNNAVPEPSASAFDQVKAALFQLESPMERVKAALTAARAAGAVTILDPAPAQPLCRDLLGLVDILTPNETEAAALTGLPSSSDPELIARNLGVATVILKLGANGCYLYRDGAGRHYPGFAVAAVDSTAAGDTFNGALGCALAEGQDLEQAVRFANAAAAVSVTRQGAQTSAPSRQEVKYLLSSSQPGISILT